MELESAPPIVTTTTTIGNTINATDKGNNSSFNKGMSSGVQQLKSIIRKSNYEKNTKQNTFRSDEYEVDDKSLSSGCSASSYSVPSDTSMRSGEDDNKNKVDDNYDDDGNDMTDAGYSTSSLVESSKRDRKKKKNYNKSMTFRTKISNQLRGQPSKAFSENASYGSNPSNRHQNSTSFTNNNSNTVFSSTTNIFKMLKSETLHVVYSKRLVYLVLFLTMSSVGTLTYLRLTKAETQSFENTVRYYSAIRRIMFFHQSSYFLII
jgi:hypothetical protein